MALDTVVGTMAAQQHPEVFQGEPGDLQPGLDGLLAQRLEQERLPGPRWAAQHEVLAAVHPFQGS